MSIGRISISIDSDLMDSVNQLSCEMGCPRSTMIRFLISDYMRYYRDGVSEKDLYVDELCKRITECEEKE